MSLENQVTRVSQGTKDTLKALINKLGGTVNDELIDEYPDLANAVVSMSDKQDKLTGTAGQVVGFGTDGNAIAQDKPSYTASDVGADPSGSAAQVQESLDTHMDDTNSHITSAERTSWNNKAPSTHASQHASGGSDPITPDSIGVYAKEETDALLANKAPSGYGYGEPIQIAYWSDSDGSQMGAYLDNYITSRFANQNTGIFRISTFVDYPACKISGNGGYADVYFSRKADNSSEFTAIVVFTGPVNVMEDADGCSYQAFFKRTWAGWKEWEYINPPMQLGVEYRTTERYLGNPVYKKMDSNGVIWWSTDQTTWKREAEMVGAMPTLNYGKLFDGIPNTNDTNNRISGAGWYRILRSVGNESYLIQLGHGYNSGGPEDMLFKVCTDRYCPSIVVLSNSVYNNKQFYTKIRITYDSTYQYVDFYYNTDSANSVNSTIWAFDKNGAKVRCEPLVLSKVDDTPSGETIVLTQDVTVIPSGNVVTSGSQLYTYGTSDLTAGSSSLETGKLYFVYE